MIELAPEILRAIESLSSGITIFLIVTVMIKLCRLLFRTANEAMQSWHLKRQTYLLEQILDQIQALRSEFYAEEERLQEQDR